MKFLFIFLICFLTACSQKSPESTEVGNGGNIIAQMFKLEARRLHQFLSIEGNNIHKLDLDQLKMLSLKLEVQVTRNCVEGSDSRNYLPHKLLVVLCYPTWSQYFKDSMPVGISVKSHVYHELIPYFKGDADKLYSLTDEFEEKYRGVWNFPHIWNAIHNYSGHIRTLLENIREAKSEGRFQESDSQWCMEVGYLDGYRFAIESWIKNFDRKIPQTLYKRAYNPERLQELFDLSLEINKYCYKDEKYYLSIDDLIKNLDNALVISSEIEWAIFESDSYKHEHETEDSEDLSPPSQ